MGSLEVAEVAGIAVDTDGYREVVDAVETRVAGAEIKGTMDRVSKVADKVAVEVADADTDTDTGTYAETDSISEDSGIDTIIGDA